MKKKKTEKKYSDNQYVQEIMESVVDFVSSNYNGTLPPKDRLLMDKLSRLLELYEEVKDYNREHGLTQTNNRGNVVKSDLLKTELEVFNQIYKICGAYGLSLKDERKIREIDSDSDTFSEMMEELNEN